jgi:hypothetical protein
MSHRSIESRVTLFATDVAYEVSVDVDVDTTRGIRMNSAF